MSLKIGLEVFRSGLGGYPPSVWRVWRVTRTTVTLVRVIDGRPLHHQMQWAPVEEVCEWLTAEKEAAK